MALLQIDLEERLDRQIVLYAKENRLSKRNAIVKVLKEYFGVK